MTDFSSSKSFQCFVVLLHCVCWTQHNASLPSAFPDFYVLILLASRTKYTAKLNLSILSIKEN